MLKFHNRIVDLLRDGDDNRRPARGGASAFSGGPPARDLALPVDHRQRVPADDRRVAAGQRHPESRRPRSTGREPASEHPGGVPGRGVPLRPQPGAAVVSRQPGRRQRRSRSSGSSSIRREKGRLIRWICAAAPGRGGASSAGRRSSTSAETRRQHVRPNKIIDTKISTPLFNLPLGAIASGDLPTSLPQRNLLRHLTWSMPSGQAIARAMGIRR